MPYEIQDEYKGYAIKAIGDWEIDILAVPFYGLDSDKQFFDPSTDIMADNFSNVPLFYQHGIETGAKTLQTKPVIIGKGGKLEKRADGWHLRGILDKTSEYASKVWEAVKDGIVAVSSDSIAHLARLDIGGKVIQYEKNRAGRIAVWPLVGVSLWDVDGGNFQPASHYATALPAMKAIYREAGFDFPELGTTDDEEAAGLAKRRTEAIERAKTILQKGKYNG